MSDNLSKGHGARKKIRLADLPVQESAPHYNLALGATAASNLKAPPGVAQAELQVDSVAHLADDGATVCPYAEMPRDDETMEMEAGAPFVDPLALIAAADDSRKPTAAVQQCKSSAADTYAVNTCNACTSCQFQHRSHNLLCLSLSHPFLPLVLNCLAIAVICLAIAVISCIAVTIISCIALPSPQP
jgi:hypothetical protein